MRGYASLLGVLAVMVACNAVNGLSDFHFVDTGAGGISATASASTTGGMPQCTSSDQCPGMDSDCQKRTCDNNLCGTKNEVQGATCAGTAGAVVCDGMGKCVECNGDGDCKDAAKPVCTNNSCQAPSCSDKHANANETDEDCGGPDCARCANGKKCGTSSQPGFKDCESGFCSGTQCAACIQDVDCQPAGQFFCNAMKICEPQRDNGKTCAQAGECKSGFCADTVCCDKKCDQVCAACVEKKTGVIDGTCSPVTMGQDPDMECTATAKSTCGASGMGCSGTIGSCVPWDNMTECLAPVCNAGLNQQTSNALCDGAGKCAMPTSKKCDPYVCNAGNSACLSDCKTAAENDCVLADYCDGAACQACGSTATAAGLAANCPAACTGGCPADGQCIINCTATACANPTCPADYNCTVNCASPGSCTNAVITCPDKLACKVDCKGTQVCKGAAVKATGSSKIDVSCDTASQVCMQLNVTCGVNACAATCAGGSKPTLTNCGNGKANACSCTPC